MLIRTSKKIFKEGAQPGKVIILARWRIFRDFFFEIAFILEKAYS